MEDVTNELSQFQRGLLITTSNNGILLGGSSDGVKYHRRFNSPTMQKDGSNEIYKRTGEIMHDTGQYYVVYRLVDNN